MQPVYQRMNTRERARSARRAPAPSVFRVRNRHFFGAAHGSIATAARPRHSERVRGFVITPTYRVAAGRPEVYLYGRLENGEACLVIDDRPQPHFFVRTAAADTVRRHASGASVESTDLTTFGGEAVARVVVGVPSDVPPLRTRLEAAGVECLEADVRFAYRYLIDRGVRGAFVVRGSHERRDRVGRVYRNPELEPATWVPSLRMLSIDIETDRRAQTLYSIALHAPPLERVLIVGERPVAGAEALPTEKACLNRFLAWVEEIDPDIITGWNVVDFDLAVLLRLCHQHGLACALGRSAAELDIRREGAMGRESRAVLDGRVVLDGLALLRGAFIRLEDYKLETAAQAILGRGKLMVGDGRGAEIESAYRDDPERLVAYNLNDARLVAEILARTGVVDLAVNRSLVTGMPLDRVSATIASVDSLYLAGVRARGRVAPSVRADAKEARISGGYVMDSRPGLYRNILVFDFKSLYPSIIRTFNIDPLTFVDAGDPARDGGGAGVGADVIRAPNGACFRRHPQGVLPELVAALGARRAAAREAGNEVAAYATKILMNSLYGVLGAGASRLFHPEVANAVTHLGHWVIRGAARHAASLGYTVIYGDTDSLFLAAGEEDPAKALALGGELRMAIEREVAARVRAEFGCESRLELELEKLYRRFLLPEVRGGEVGSKKRYAGLLIGEDGTERLELVGLEAVRRDWSAVSKRFQRELLDLVFHDRPVEAFIRGFLADLRAGKLDDLLVYKKAIRKSLDAYTETTPPHVRAARKLGEGAGRIIAYVVTAAGPEPVGATTAPLDYDHYVEHQIAPIADAVLRFLGLEFADVAGTRQQLRLF
jgi:DNA polymerase-2